MRYSTNQEIQQVSLALDVEWTSATCNFLLLFPFEGGGTFVWKKKYKLRWQVVKIEKKMQIWRLSQFGPTTPLLTR